VAVAKLSLLKVVRLCCREGGEEKSQESEITVSTRKKEGKERFRQQRQDLVAPGKAIVSW